MKINFREQKGFNALERIVCYSFKKDKEIVITGRSPGEVIKEGTVLCGLPYGNLQGAEFTVQSVEHRPHKGDKNLFYWTAICRV
jgi:hypothetical protein